MRPPCPGPCEELVHGGLDLGPQACLAALTQEPTLRQSTYPGKAFESFP